MNQSALEFAKSLLFELPHIAVLIACIIYVAKKASANGVLMMIGNFITLCTSIFFYFILPRMWDMDISSETRSAIVTIVSIIGFIGYTLFTVGFFLLIMKHIQLHKRMGL